MKKLLILALLLIPVSMFGQVKKQPGENSNISWTFAASEEEKISGFRVYAAALATGPFTFTGNSTSASARGIVIPTQFPPNSTKVFYQVKSFRLTPLGTTEESDPSPLAGIEVDLACKCQ